MDAFILVDKTPTAEVNMNREGIDLGLFITLVRQVFKLRFLIRWLNNFRDFY